MLISQGTARAQMTASQINRAFYDAAIERRGELSRATDVVIDVRSFADRIPSTWVPLDHDLLNSYYGAQAFEEWGLRSMVHLNSGKNRPRVHFAVGRIDATPDGQWRFLGGHGLGTRRYRSEMASSPREGTVIMDYDRVFGPK